MDTSLLAVILLPCSVCWIFFQLVRLARKTGWLLPKLRATQPIAEQDERDKRSRVKRTERWYYPAELANDLKGVQLPDKVKEEIFACAFEYSRCVIPQYTNWNRYLAFMRIIVMGIVAEFRGEMVDVAAGDQILGYSLSGTLAALFEGTPGHVEMAREYRSFLLITADKSSKRRDSELFRRYVNSLARSPRNWFRMRDADALARFTIASALACNDQNTWYTDAQFEILAEIGCTLYDSIAFYKHRSEGETNSTFAYVPSDLRLEAFERSRETLWALDMAWATSSDPAPQIVINFVRFFGGPIHMMMRRYRFVEEGLTIGQPETERVITETRQNVKLWNRVDSSQSKRKVVAADTERYQALITREKDLMFDGLAAFLEDNGDGRYCTQCRFRDSYGAERRHEFGGVRLCAPCEAQWRCYSTTLPARAAEAFPELAPILAKSHKVVHM